MVGKDGMVFIYRNQQGRFFMQAADQRTPTQIDPWSDDLIPQGTRLQCCDEFDYWKERGFQVQCVECSFYQDEDDWRCPHVAGGQECGYGKTEQDQRRQ